VAAIERFDAIAAGNAGYAAINVGTGTGTTVIELVAAFEAEVGRKLDVGIGPRRDGDVAGAYSLVERAHDWLGWQAGLSIQQGIRDALRWSAARAGRLAQFDATRSKAG
jgi:UDP-glucose 4-epimerase